MQPHKLTSHYLAVISSLVQAEKETLASSSVVVGGYSVSEAAAADELCSLDVTSSQLSNLLRKVFQVIQREVQRCTDSLERTSF